MYYTALLVNVGCHTDAHEQAKWFGDDIALKAGKYEHGLGSLREPPRECAAWAPAAAAAPLSRRARVRDLGSPRGRRHDRPACADRSLARGAARARGRRYGRARRRVREWDGKAGRASSWATRPDRVAHRAAGGVRRGRTPHRWDRGRETLARRRGGSQFDPELAARLCADAGAMLGGLDELRTWEAVIAGEPALAVVLSGKASTPRCWRSRLRRPQVPVHDRALARGRGPGRGGRVAAGLANDEIRTVRRAALVHDFGRLGVPNAIWDKPGP